MFRANGKANCVRLNSLVLKFFCGKLAVSCRCRMDNKALYIGNIGKQREYSKAVNEFVYFLDAAFDLKGKDGTATVREIFLIQFIVRVIGQ